MQQDKKNILRIIGNAAAGTTWVSGLLLAGSDSPFMPWVNILGLLIFMGASASMGRRFRRIDRTGIKNPFRNIANKAKNPGFGRIKSNRRVHIRYA